MLFIQNAWWIALLSKSLLGGASFLEEFVINHSVRRRKGKTAFSVTASFSPHVCAFTPRSVAFKTV